MSSLSDSPPHLEQAQEDSDNATLTTNASALSGDALVLPCHSVLPASTPMDITVLLQDHVMKKDHRRESNRKSAQQSRARKKVSECMLLQCFCSSVLLLSLTLCLLVVCSCLLIVSLQAALDELQTENLRLQHLVNLLDSQPEVIFSMTSQGKITYISPRWMDCIKPYGMLPSSAAGC